MSICVYIPLGKHQQLWLIHPRTATITSTCKWFKFTLNNKLSNSIILKETQYLVWNNTGSLGFKAIVEGGNKKHCDQIEMWCAGIVCIEPDLFGVTQTMSQYLLMFILIWSQLISLTVSCSRSLYFLSQHSNKRLRNKFLWNI